jgi:hypothetical protein
MKNFISGFNVVINNATLYKGMTKISQGKVIHLGNFLFSYTKSRVIDKGLKKKYISISMLVLLYLGAFKMRPIFSPRGNS